MLETLTIDRIAESRRPGVDFNQLGFGNVFSDHMFSMVYTGGQWRQPEILPYGDIGLAPGVATLHYGQTVFEGLKAFRGADGTVRVFRPDKNIQRLRASCERLCIPMIDDEIFYEAIRLLIEIDHAWIPAKRGQALYIRPIIFGTESHLEVRPSATFRFLMMTSPVRTYYEDNMAAIALKVDERYARSAPGGTGSAKTAGNYAASLLPGDLARREGFDQVLWLDGAEHRYVEEVGQMNIFFRFRDEVITPELRGTILPGVTRDSVLVLLRDFGVPVAERRISIDEVMQAGRRSDLLESFGAGTAAVIAPVGRISFRGETLTVNENRMGELTRRLYEEITAIQTGEIADRHGWNMLVQISELVSAAS
ncbi:MAG: branched-chain amino acid aminotransferase [SAR324 cluster bacterium]|nr:branched-chain amino acid aminotransferase [SAR324 cluster bacterium]